MRFSALAALVLAWESALAGPPSGLLDRAADAVDLARVAALRMTCVERVREVRYAAGAPAEGSSRTFHWDLERGDGRGHLAAVRAKEGGRLADGPDATFADLHWPDSHSWLGVVGRENRGFFRFDDLGTIDREGMRAAVLAFRGALPFDRGEDVREWEGTVELDPRSGLVLSVHAAPSTQEARGARRYDAYERKTGWDFFGLRFKIGKRPRAAAAHVRFQTSSEGSAIPSEVRYETLRWIRRGVTTVERAQIRSYDDCRRAEGTTGAPVPSPPPPTTTPP